MWLPQSHGRPRVRLTFEARDNPSASAQQRVVKYPCRLRDDPPVWAAVREVVLNPDSA